MSDDYIDAALELKVTDDGNIVLTWNGEDADGADISAVCLISTTQARHVGAALVELADRLDCQDG